MTSVLDERWKPLVGTPSKPAIPSNILVPDPSPARSEISDTDSPTLLPPSPVCSFIHQRRQGQYVPRPPVWKIDSPNQYCEGLIKAGARANNFQDKPIKYDWILPLPGSDQYDPVQLMADVFNEKLLTVNILTLPETGHTNGIPPTEPVAASGATARQLDVHDTSNSSMAVEQAQNPRRESQTNQENHDPLRESAVETGESRRAKRQAQLFTDPDPIHFNAQSSQARPVTEANFEGPNQPLGMYPAGEARHIDTDGVDPPVYPYDSISNYTIRGDQPGDAARSQAQTSQTQTSQAHLLSLSLTKEVIIGSQTIPLEVQWSERGDLETVRLNVNVVPGRYTIHGGRRLEETEGETQAATKALGKVRGSLGRFRQKVSRGPLGSLKFSRGPRKAIKDVLLRWPPDHPKYIEVKSVPSGPPRNDPPVPAPATQHLSSEVSMTSSENGAARLAERRLRNFLDETAQQPVPRSGNVQETYKLTTTGNKNDTRVPLASPSPLDIGSPQYEVETDLGQSHNRNSQPPSVRRPTSIRTWSQSVPTLDNYSWPLPSSTGERSGLSNGTTNENEPIGAAL